MTGSQTVSLTIGLCHRVLTQWLYAAGNFQCSYSSFPRPAPSEASDFLTLVPEHGTAMLLLLSLG